ncbi:hypothetical protein IHV25_04475 [Phaeovibrio sulfidiphilus]|uniref:PEP-CTERM protein-sorting domain-containing protein n=1 Tax=Phaeovibrio sulfidiphilus TaxID=1220600 RepID=A0A8J7CVZ3_9PROT|nr:hypothetical protein [Phaeovibrio sulfidiphilus]MBE1236901.1 hypothetical protein [Phaeovibrio sulfidiphilus]
MFHTPVSRSALSGLLFGAAALFASAVFAPATAEARDYRIKLGSFSTSLSERDANGAQLTGIFQKYDNKKDLLHLVAGKKAGSDSWLTEVFTAPVPSGSNQEFSDSYSFSLKTGATLSLTLSLGAQSLDVADKTLIVRLTRADGTQDVRTAGTHNTSLHVFSNLAAGDYTMSIAGAYGAEGKSLDLTGYRVSYDASMSFGEPVGDVPLPGALVLLGTALAGAGVTARRKAKAAKAEA